MEENKTNEEISEETGSEKKELTTKDLQRIELEILTYIDQVCKEENLRYYLHAGTLLGAVRHHGFIPWDDDIDIIMPRKHYMRFIKAMQRRKDSKYKIQSIYTNPDYPFFWAKVYDSTTEIHEHVTYEVKGMGVFVDVMPIDNLPDDPKKRKMFQHKVRLLRSLRYHADATPVEYARMGAKDRLKCKIGRIYGAKHALYKMEKLITKYKDQKTKYANNVVTVDNCYIEVPADTYGWGTTLEFEGKQFPVPKEYDRYLTTLFGDYMKLPPVEKQVSNHDFTAYQN